MSVSELVVGAAVFAGLVLGHALIEPYWNAARAAREQRNRERFHRDWYEAHHDTMDT